MAYIGAVAPGYDPTRASVPQLDAERFSGTGSATAFTLARQVVSPTDIDVVVENVTQEPTIAYSVNGNTLTFTEAPGSGTNNIYVIYRGSGISNYAFVPDGSITYAKLANNIKQFTVDAVTANGTGTTVELTEAPASANSIIVSVDGVIQTAPTNYTLSGSTITFTGTPDNGANVVVRHIGFRTTSTVTALQASSVTATELADSSVTNAKIVSVANTKITGLVTASQIANVANTQLTGTITGSQISSNTLSNTVFQTGSVENYMNAQNLGFGMRNRIINGAMVIDQRNAGAATASSYTGYLVDRFTYQASVTGKLVFQQNAGSLTGTNLPAGFTNYLGATSQSAYSVSSSDYFLLTQQLEGFNTSDLQWGTAYAKTITLSFWVRSSLTGTFSVAFRNETPDRSYVATYTINSANTWEQKTITIAGDTTGTWTGATNGIGLRVNFGLGVGSTYNTTAGAWAAGNYLSATGATSVVGTNGATFYITGVQLEKGSTATSFDYRPYTTELQLCERYCQRILGRDVGNTSSDWMGSGWNFTTTSHFTIVPLRTMLRSATGQSLYLSGAVGNYSVLNSSGTPIATSAMSIDTPSTRCLVITATVASGLTSGYPGSIYTGNSSSYYALITAEL